MSDKRISIVMITHNRGDQIRIPLERLLALPEQPHLIVVDNASSDGTVEAARSMGSGVDMLALDQNLGGAPDRISG
jgi:GT2 family glycosyltransferase